MKRVVLESVDSTNNYAEIIAKKTYGNYLIIANSQTNGRGQFDRKWFSESGKSITLSFLLRNKKDNKELKKSIIKQIPYTISSVMNFDFPTAATRISAREVISFRFAVCHVEEQGRA